MDKRKESGAASLFAVIFSAMLLTILAAGFVKLMLKDQQQAINNDLSQSAYDAALAGVEDAKRVIRACQKGNASACDALEKKDCNSVRQSSVLGGAGNAQETLVQTNSSNGRKFDQAYTCLKVSMDTEDFLYVGAENKVQLVPLRARGAFDKVIIEWFNKEDNANKNVALADVHNGDIGLPEKATWSTQAPAVLRAQVITPGNNFTIDSLDSSSASQAVFLRPNGIVSGVPAVENVVHKGSLRRATDTPTTRNEPTGVLCSKDFAHPHGHSCRAIIELDEVSPEASANAFLAINHLYKGANVRVSVMKGTEQVMLYGAQPAVDSTGRANNLFRRVEARLRLGEDIWYPAGSVEVLNNLCKDFSLAGNIVEGGACDP